MEKFEFKTLTGTYEKEREGLKPNTVREIDLMDERYRKLIMFNEHGYNPGELIIRIKRAEDTKDFFERKINDITIYKNLMIISWVHENGRSK